MMAMVVKEMSTIPDLSRSRILRATRVRTVTMKPTTLPVNLVPYSKLTVRSYYITEIVC